MIIRPCCWGLALLLQGSFAGHQARIDWVPRGDYGIACTETTIGQFRRFVEATGMVTLSERRGGGKVYEAGGRLPADRE